MGLVAEIGEAFRDEDVEGFVFFLRGGVGGADAEDGGDQLRVVLGNAVDDGAAPVVAAQDDAGEAELGGEGGDVGGCAGVGVGLEGVCSWGVGATVAAVE